VSRLFSNPLSAPEGGEGQGKVGDTPNLHGGPTPPHSNPLRPRVERGRTLLGLLTAALILAADQISKWWILNGLDLPRLGQVRLLPVLDLTIVWNRGVTFGMLNGAGPWSGPLIAVVALAIVGALFLWLRRTRSTVTAIAIGAVAGGAIGNVMDRLRHGAVVDFIHAHVGDWSWYVFNVADAAIVCGVIALLIESQFSAERPKPAQGHVSCDLPKKPSRG
jgi:signal peptidase II